MRATNQAARGKKSDHVQEALRGLDDVCSVEVRLREGKALVEHQGATEASAMIEALRGVGYESRETPC